MARIHRVSRIAGKLPDPDKLTILSPVGTETVVDLPDTKPETIIALLNDHAVDIAEKDEFAFVVGTTAVDIARVIDGEIVPLSARRDSGVESYQINPVTPEDLREQARAAEQQRAHNREVSNPRKKKHSPEFKSFLARIKYMIYMDHPRGSAPKINLTPLEWSLSYTNPESGNTYTVERMGGGEVELVAPDFGMAVAPDEVLNTIKEKGWS